MKKFLAFAGVSAALAAGLLATAPAYAATANATSPSAMSPFRYYDTFYGPNPWWSCSQRGNLGLQRGEWYDYDCRPGTSWVDLYIQVSPN
ncbi:hypothetical protein [Nonomuraea sp. NPDC003709]|uniref:hypothetical protein n=1 Tax=Nonomuraea sp. NPDC003709 TaxID=3154450 RepID=UPI0033B08B18